MKRKKRNETEEILRKATKDASREWGYDYPLSHAFVNPFGSIVALVFIVPVPMKIIDVLLRDSGLEWLQFVYFGIVFIPLLLFARRCRLRMLQYLEQLLAKLNNSVCRKCEYDLRGLTNFDCCPECGTTVTWLEDTDEQA